VERWKNPAQKEAEGTAILPGYATFYCCFDQINMSEAKQKLAYAQLCALY